MPSQSHISLFLAKLFFTVGHGWWNLTLSPCPSLNKAVVTGHSSPTSELKVVYPISTSDHLSMEDMEAVTSAIQEQFEVTGLGLIPLRSYHVSG